ncbi:hypothetical protein GCM10010515_29060 [Streptomyces fructofermentans]|uniref:Uncharacterized protein n=1 Tax=Streptomyces fructofermentans TaxID=152141 RepID=A0A918KDF6_9ACTN|nr:hypothetical protein GCM10010515_29060 [Streptomyces fructofermentans]
MPSTSASWLWAALFARSTSADTDASKEDAAAEAEDAAAETAARPDSRSDSSADGAVPLNEAVSGGVGRSPVDEPESLSLLHDVRTAAPRAATHTAAVTAAVRVLPGRRGSRGCVVFIGS